MKNYESLSHTRYDCKYRRKKIYGAIRRHLGEIFNELAKQKESRILEGHLKGDHVHRCISIPPKFAVSSVVGFMKGKSAISVPWCTTRDLGPQLSCTHGFEVPHEHFQTHSAEVCEEGLSRCFGISGLLFWTPSRSLATYASRAAPSPQRTFSFGSSLRSLSSVSRRLCARITPHGSRWRLSRGYSILSFVPDSFVA